MCAALVPVAHRQEHQQARHSIRVSIDSIRDGPTRLVEKINSQTTLTLEAPTIFLLSIQPFTAVMTIQPSPQCRRHLL